MCQSRFRFGLCLLVPASVVLMTSCGLFRHEETRLDGLNIRIEFNESMHSRVVAKLGGKEIPMGAFTPSEFVTIAGREIKDFRLTKTDTTELTDDAGNAVRWRLAGENSSLRKEVSVNLYDEFPQMALFEVGYTNVGSSDIHIDGWTNNHYSIAASQASSEPAFWSYQGASYKNRPDWVLPLKPGFQQENFLGMNASDYGGGIPVADVWRKDAGIAVGHVEMAPKLVSLPVAMPDARHATVAVSFPANRILKPGETLKTFRTFIAVHQGDYFETLSEYRRFMLGQGIEPGSVPENAYEPIWCAWGYGRDFTPRQIYDSLPMVKKLGFRWVTLDDGWQTSEGDWQLDRKKFPAGDRDIRKMVDRIHSEGLKAQLWWAPLAVDPGTDLLRNQPDQLLLNADASTQKISWWNSFYLCPAYPKVREDAERFVVKALKVWGFDGLKIDGQHLNAAPPCYNKAHNHSAQEESVEGVPGFFKAIYSAALSVKPEVLIEICPCGTAYSFFTMPYMSMAVASDPKSSWQIRTKGKTLKALLDDSAVYFGDHVEMSDGGDDFASTVGIGGLIGSNFTWPSGSAATQKLDLTPQKEKVWKRWIEIYKSKMLSKGQYLGALYDIGFDRPEAHAVLKDGSMYYAFYATSWRGQLELRGLDRRAYRVTDYVNGKDLGKVSGPAGTLTVEFDKYLLLEATPE